MIVTTEPIFQPRSYRFHCDQCVTNGSFEAPTVDLIHSDSTGRAVVFYADCSQGHRQQVAPEFLVQDPTARFLVSFLGSFAREPLTIG
jgi:hypothetical protein